MDISRPAPGKYIVAVSGGVDSVSLLHLLMQEPHLKLVVAHLDHGIRPDSARDRRLVQSLAREAGLPFVYDEVHLGEAASEAAARKARYDFLRRVRRQVSAQGIITAHHEDDALETAILNLIRGTGRKGLASLDEGQGIVRPLLDVPKRTLLEYGRRNGLKWREDQTNKDTRYARNYVRHQLLPRFDADSREQLLRLVRRQRQLNRQIDDMLAYQLHLQPATHRLERRSFVGLPHDVSKELLAAWFRHRELPAFDRKTLERLVVSAKTGRPGSRWPIKGDWYLQVEKDDLALARLER